jgi:hypothetical protein
MRYKEACSLKGGDIVYLKKKNPPFSSMKILAIMPMAKDKEPPKSGMIRYLSIIGTNGEQCTHKQLKPNLSIRVVNDKAWSAI